MPNQPVQGQVVNQVQPQKSGSNTGVIIAIVVAVVLLLCCCCSSVGTFMLFQNPDFQEGFQEGFEEGLSDYSY